MYKEIKGWEDSHLISEFGEIISKERYIGGPWGKKCLKKEKSLKWNYQKGYPTICLYHDKRTKRYFVHRLVWENFVAEILPGMQINHKDGKKGNPYIKNLEIVTPKENTQHAWRTGLSKKRLGSDTSSAKLTEEQVSEMRRLYQSGIKECELVIKYNLHQTTIHYALKGKTWKHVA